MITLNPIDKHITCCCPWCKKKIRSGLILFLLQQ